MILYVVSTPIGNLEDISLRALRVLREVRLIAAEDTRHARVLLQHYQIATATIAYHEHNKDERLPTILAALAEGDVALISDAGTPGLSDPGYELVAAAIAAGHTVTAVPGASALLSALVSSGVPFGQFTYVGFPPRRSRDRRTWFTALALESRPIVLYESPHRLRDCLADMQAALGSARPIIIARELTKLHEEVRRETIAQAISHFTATNPRGEFVLIITPDPHPDPSTIPNDVEVADPLAQIDALVAGGISATTAVKQVATRLHTDRRELYKQYSQRIRENE